MSETGVDTLRVLFEVERVPAERLFELGRWRVDVNAGLSLVALEGHPSDGGAGLASTREVLQAGEEARQLVADHFGLRRDRGVSRLDVTTTRRFQRELDARAFLAGMAALELPRCDSIRRGTPVQSIGWVHSRGRRLLARCYDKGLEQGGAPFESIRFEDQGRFSSSAGRPPVEVAAEPEFQRRRLVQRFGPMARSLRGVKAMTVPVLTQALADEVRFGYRSYREAERLAGALSLFAAGVRPSRGEATLYRRRRELLAAGFVPVDGEWQESAEVDLGEELEAALEELA